MTTGKHIRLFLVDGSPLGIKTAEIIGWTGKVLDFSRGLLPEALRRTECSKTGIYLLTGHGDDGQLVVYVGESDELAKRLKQHDADDDKAFFEQVTLIVSKDENLTKSHVRYLEHQLIDRIKLNKQAVLKNGNHGAPVNLPEAEQSDMAYILDQLDVLLTVLGLTFMQERPQRKSSQPLEAQVIKDKSPGVTFELSYLNGQIKATAYELNGDFVLEKDSLVRNLNADVYQTEFKHSQYFTDRFMSLQSLCVPVEGNPLILKVIEDIPFKTPSGASNFVTGANYNGRKFWKVKHTGQTYGDWRKQQLEAIYTP